MWTRQVGESPIKLLLLHGGPGFNHEYLECFADFLPPEGVELYFYDQLGSYFSDQPDDSSLWIDTRFREEVEQVRSFLGLESFYLCGQSWGGYLAIEYALKYPSHLKGLVISNMTASIPAYVASIQALRNQLPEPIVSRMLEFEERGDFEAEAYQELVMEHLYKKHICRLDPWPEAVRRGFAHANMQVYNTMQGPNEFLVTGNFKDWDRFADLKDIHTPTLLLSGRHDTMAPSDIEEMGRRIPASRVAICEAGSHLSMWDDQETYFAHLLQFIRDVEADRFNRD
ncbi:proline iminopeptidase-family hydrolase [Ferroacidibacillus organovorans]|uniref:proline iminopeptidase-family hydrolase n=1 Tax=Ferroacidibacillus organovorans TaxID=1765683 RepID=UPI001E5C48B8|nr:proline iminopeptidase-family hydrolase [Ferroacidibacillus organovorans]